MYHQVSSKFSASNMLRIIKFVILIPFYRFFKQGPVETALWAFVRFRLFATGVSTIKYSRITPTLFVGGQIREEGWRRLQKAGVTSVVNMRREHDDRAAGVSIPEANYLHLPTIDDTPVTIEDLKRGADWIHGQIEQGGVVYVHCAAGSGRAPSMGAAYLMTHQGMTTDQALATIKARRPFIMPMPSQVARLREYEAWLAKQGE